MRAQLRFILTVVMFELECILTSFFFCLFIETNFGHESDIKAALESKVCSLRRKYSCGTKYSRPSPSSLCGHDACGTFVQC